MSVNIIPGVLLAITTASAATAAQPPRAAKAHPAAIEVMIVAGYHMSNPGQDVINFKSDDVLMPRRQKEIRQIVASLARFRPTKVAVEWAGDYAAARWVDYRAGTLAASRNEVVQLGFRLASATGATPLGADAEGDFPFGPLAQFAQANGFGSLLSEGLEEAKANTASEQRILKQNGIPALLRAINQPTYIARTHGIYMSTLRIGKGEHQPGVELISSWYRRNARICANLLQAARPGDRVVALFGGNHAYLLRQCVLETPGAKLIEALAYLPRGSSATSPRK